MPTWIKSGLAQTIALGGAGLLVGVAAAWFALLSAEGAEAVAAYATVLYPLLAAALPLALLALNWRPTGPPASIMLAGALGPILAHLCFLVACTNIPSIFGGESPVAMSQALQPAIGWLRPAIALGATLAAAALLALRTRVARR